MDINNLGGIFALVIFTLALISFPILGLIDALKKHKWKMSLVGISAPVAFIGFLLLSGAAIISHPNIWERFAFGFIFGFGNAILWPYLIGKIASANGKVVYYWFALALFPVVYLWFLIYIFNSQAFW